MKFNSFIWILYLLIVQFACTKSPEPPETFLGNYFEPEGSECWICSIFPEFLVYENEFWDYKTKSVQQEEIQLILSSNSGEKQVLKLKKQDSLFKVSGLNKEYVCNKDGRDIKIMPSIETPVWEAGAALIKGVIFDDTTQHVQVKIEAEKYFTTRDSEVRVAEVNDKGQFSISIPVLNSQSVELIYGEHRWRRIFVSPGDTLIVLINGQTGRPVHFMGDNAEICYHMENVLDTLLQLEVRTIRWDKEPEEFGKLVDSLAIVQLEYLNRYASEMNSSDLFNIWGEMFVECSRVFMLGSYSYMSTLHGAGSSDRLDFDHPYYEFINSIDFNDSLMLLEEKLGSVVGQLNNYYQKVMSEEINSESQIHKDFCSFLSDYYSELSYEDSLFVYSLRDSLNSNGIFSQALLGKIQTITDPFKDEFEYKVLKARMDRRIDFFLAQDYTLMRDLMFMKTYADIKLARKFKVLEYVYDRTFPLIQSKILQNDLALDYYRFSKRIEELQSIEMNANQSHKPGEHLLSDIISTYKDTALILDFWYTACGPCRADFERMKSIKTQLYDVPIKFIYICYSSSEEDWQNVVKEFEVSGDHYLLTGSQFAYFSNKFQISSAPRYVLINREGIVENDNFSRPTTYERYRRELSKYIGR
jgi:hypothetical protein